MADSNKRVLTAELRESFTADNVPPSSAGLPDDVLQRLRSVGSRVRKSVTEGYQSPTSFNRAQTTGSIFCSANDALRQVYSHPPPQTLHVNPERKRSRSVTGRDDIEEEVFPSAVAADPKEEDKSSRQVKPLRKPSAKLLQTQSLPSSVFSFGGHYPGPAVPTQSVPEEEDWSHDASFSTVAEQGFEPMAF